MSVRDAVVRLTRALDDEARALFRLRELLERGRLAFVALKPSELEQALAALAPDAERAQQAAARRRDAFAAAVTLLGLTAPATLGELAAAAPADQRAALQRAADAAKAAAGALRVETGVGARLLEFSRGSQEAMFRDLLEATRPRSYDRNARSTTGPAATGRIVSGSI